MDNTQERTAFDLGWLCAAFEGEGNFSLVQARNKKGLQIHPRIQLCNYDTAFIENAARILDNHEVGYYIYKQAEKNGELKKMTVTGFKRATKILELMLPYLVTKVDRAALVLAFLKSRASGPIHEPYRKIEFWLFRELRRKNHHGRDRDRKLDRELAVILRDYTPDPTREDIVHALMKISD